MFKVIGNNEDCFLIPGHQCAFLLVSTDFPVCKSKAPYICLSIVRLFLVAEVGGEVAATIALRETDDPSTAKLLRMFVHPRFRRRGLASRFVARLYTCCSKVPHTRAAHRARGSTCTQSCCCTYYIGVLNCIYCQELQHHTIPYL